MGAPETTEEKILTAAKKVFLQKGMDGARMQDIADEAGINKALLHYYFRNKQQLFEKIFIEAISALLPKVVTIMESDTSLFEKIETFCKEYINQVMLTPYVPIFIINEVNKQPEVFLKKILGDRQLPLHALQQTINREIKEKNIRPVNPLQLLMNIISMCLFPFLARPLIQLATGIDLQQFMAMMEQRKKEIPLLIINSIKV